MDLEVRKRSFSQSDHSWLGSAHALDTARTIEIDKALFDVTETTGEFPNGYIPGGVVLAKRTSDGKWGHYDPGTVVNEVQSVIATGGTAGDFTLTLDGETTAAIAYNANAAAVQAALLALSNIDSGDVVCAGGPLPGTAVTITWGGQYADTDVPALVVTDNITDGTAVITTTTAGGGSGAGAAGLTVAKGFLAWPISVVDDRGVVDATGPAIGALLEHGQIIEANLPTNHRLDAAAKAALAGQFTFR